MKAEHFKIELFDIRNRLIWSGCYNEEYDTVYEIRESLLTGDIRANSGTITEISEAEYLKWQDEQLATHQIAKMKAETVDTIPIVFNGVTYNIPVILAERWCKVLSEFEGKEITLN